jgi:hypothetical protein
VLLKLDFERHKTRLGGQYEGFDPKWCQWINNFINQGSVGVKVNDDIGHYFQIHKELDRKIHYHLSSLI